MEPRLPRQSAGNSRAIVCVCPDTQPGRRRVNSFADAHDRQPSADHASGSREDFLRRHGVEAEQASREGGVALSELRQKLLTRAGDVRNVLLAIDHCASRGQTAGPNGLKPSDLDRHARTEMAQSLGNLLASGDYRPGQTRTIHIDKGGNRGKRPIVISDLDSRCAERAILQVIRPLTEAQYLESNLGFRARGRSREEAIALAERIAYDTGRWVWITEDLSNAFEMIPTGRLMQIVRQLFRHDRLCDQIEKMITRPRGRGVRQGGPLSPEMLNVYLHPTLDEWWQRNFPDVPMLRYADDLLILARTTDEGFQLHQALQRQATSIGMPVKGNALTTVKDLTCGQAASWLGYSLQRTEHGIRASIADKSWQKLEELLRLSWETDLPSLHALDCMEGWISQQGLAFQTGDVDRVHACMRRLANEAGFDEIPTREEVVRLWRKAYRRDWVHTRRETLLHSRRSSGLAARFAQQHCDFQGICESGESVLSTVTPSSTTRLPRLFLHTDVSYVSGGCTGSWAYLIVDSHDQENWDRCGSGSHPHTSLARMALTAVLEGLRAIGSQPHRIELITYSRYVDNGLAQICEDPSFLDPANPMLAKNWRHVRLWRRVWVAMQPHEVHCRWLPHHRRYARNNFVKDLAREALRDREPQSRGVLPIG